MWLAVIVSAFVVNERIPAGNSFFGVEGFMQLEVRLKRLGKHTSAC